ncbi:MAG TPA: XdhC/CoxI family protein [Puia sp.]|jgi:xanthine/CO dehydrogenase XdhC/CoxF family maturation factor|nr:XdhC/CoxI family protein [Puia sp.]
MKEIRDILKAFAIAQREGRRSALATVVMVEGSSYRRPGARMLVTDDGQLTGAISGGCLEGDALRKALFAIHQQRNKLVTYDTTHEDDLRFGVQLGCNGIVHILFEPIPEGEGDHPLRLLQELAEERRDAALVTLFSPDHGAVQPGTCLLYREGRVRGLLPEELREMVLADVRQVFSERVSRFPTYMAGGQVMNAFVEYVPRPPALVIAGAGNDVIPLVRLTSMLGWHTTVVDGRGHYATRERFGAAEEVVVAKPEQVLERVNVDGQTLFVLMTHNYNYDLGLLKELLQRDICYIGVLGPKKKLDRMLGELQEQGIIPGERQQAAIHGPVGLDIGAETPEEIAVSIVAEIKAVLTGRSGMSLKEKQSSIHA